MKKQKEVIRILTCGPLRLFKPGFVETHTLRVPSNAGTDELFGLRKPGLQAKSGIQTNKTCII